METGKGVPSGKQHLEMDNVVNSIGKIRAKQEMLTDSIQDVVLSCSLT